MNEYDLGLPIPLAPLGERRRKIPRAVWCVLEEVKRRTIGVVGHRLKEVRLFGSYARAEFDEDSDVDVLVLVSSLEPQERSRLVDAACDASTDDLIVSPLVMTEASLDELRSRDAILAEDVDTQGIPVEP